MSRPADLYESSFVRRRRLLKYRRDGDSSSFQSERQSIRRRLRRSTSTFKSPSNFHSVILEIPRHKLLLSSGSKASCSHALGLLPQLGVLSPEQQPTIERNILSSRGAAIRQASFVWPSHHHGTRFLCGVSQISHMCCESPAIP